MVHHQGFVRSQVAISQAVHEPVGKRIQPGGCARLGNARAAAAKRREGSHRDHGRSGEAGICGRCEVHMESVQVQIIGAVEQHVVGRAGGRCSRTV